MDFIYILYIFKEKLLNDQDNVLFSCCTSFDPCPALPPSPPPQPITEFVNDSAFLGVQYRWSLGQQLNWKSKDLGLFCVMFPILAVSISNKEGVLKMF